MAKKRILIVDDDLTLSKLMTLLFEMRQYEVLIANDGDEALIKAYKEKPDIILLDIMLPKKNGYEVCFELRQDKLTHHIPIIMLTGDDAQEAKIRGLYTGADDYITKPFDTEELFARVESVMRRRQTPFDTTEDKALIITEIDKIIRHGLIVPHFQPLFYLKSRKLLGFEILNRPPEGNYFTRPEILFDTALRVGMLFNLETSCYEKALNKLGDWPKKTTIFFNASPYMVQDTRYRDFFNSHKDIINPDHVVLELTERTAIRHFDVFFQTLSYFKQDGFKIAIDDIGSGYASLNSIVEVKPDFIKIDMHLIRDIYKDPVKQKMMEVIVKFCEDIGIVSIAEGIETQEELRTLIKFNVRVGQGYFLGKPSQEIQIRLE